MIDSNTNAQIQAAQEEAWKSWQTQDTPWTNLPVLDLPEAKRRKLAKVLLESLAAHAQEIVVLEFSAVAKGLVEYCYQELQTAGIKTKLLYESASLKEHFWQTASIQAVTARAKARVDYYQNVSKRFVIISENHKSKPPHKSEILFKKLLKPLHTRILSGDLYYTLTLIPTPADAKLDNIPHQDYLEIYYQMCLQDWEQISNAQLKLISQFNQADQVRFTNSDGTDLTMSIAGFTFANSLAAKNVPGSEFFSAPVRESVEGTLVAKGRFVFDYGEVVEDIMLKFVAGRIVEWSAKHGEATLTQVITADDGQGEGSRYVGELGLGTNPALTQHVTNGLLVEKIAGSFHIALGSSYTFTEYAGQPINVNNGNISQAGIHWDLTTMLFGKAGKIYLDGELVHDNGIWLIPDTEAIHARR